MNLLMMILSITPLTVKDELFDTFMTDVHDGYQVYEEIENENNSNNYYSLKIVRGIFKGTPCYGIAFCSEDAGAYELAIEKDDVLYKLEQNDRKDSYGISIKADSMIEIHIYDKNGNEQDFIGESKLLKFSEEDLAQSSKAIYGLNNGKSFTKLTNYTSKIPFLYAFIYSAVVLIGICAVAIIIMAVRRKGMFNKKVRSEGVINIESLINEAKQKEEVDLWDGYKPEKEEIIIEATEVVEEANYIDLKEYLISKGYLTDYSLMSEDEKNNLMVELMFLKNNKKISEDTYYEETYKLWKK